MHEIQSIIGIVIMGIPINWVTGFRRFAIKWVFHHANFPCGLLLSFLPNAACLLIRKATRGRSGSTDGIRLTVPAYPHFDEATHQRQSEARISLKAPDAKHHLTNRNILHLAAAAVKEKQQSSTWNVWKWKIETADDSLSNKYIKSQLTGGSSCVPNRNVHSGQPLNPKTLTCTSHASVFSL